MKRNTEGRGQGTGRQASGWLRSTFAALTLALVGTLAGTANAQDTAAPAGNRLEAVDFQALGGQQMQFRLRTSGPAPAPLAFTIDKPARISLDLPGVALALPSRRMDVKAGGIDSLVAGEAGGRTRVVLNLDAMVPYETRVDGNSIVLTVGAAPAGAASSAPAVAAASNAEAATAPASRKLENIDFRRGPEGAGRVIVRLSDARTPVNVRQEGGQVVVDFIGAELPDALARRYDVTDFATPVTYIDALRAEGKARVVIAAGADFEQLAYQSDDQYVVEVKPPVKTKAAADDRKEYTGERLTLNFQDIEVRAVLQLLADTSGQNIVVSDSVAGNVTLRLQNVPWDQALDIVMRAKGLDMRRQDNVILVGPAEELAAREKADLQARKEVQELAPLRGEYLQVNYAKATDLAALIKSGSGGSGGNSLLSARGSVAVDERTNTLLLQDTPDRLADIRRMVSTLDVPVRQVLIESRIVIVNDDFSRDLGVRLGANYFESRGPADSGLFAVGGSAAGMNTAVGGAIDNLATGGSIYPIQVPAGNSNFTDRYNVNLPVSNPAGRVSLALLDFPWLLDLELSAAQAEGRGEIQSSPRVITANQREASIEQGVEIPYQESSSSGATSTQFKKAVLSLRVKPQITPDNRIILDLTVSKDSVGQLVASATGGNVPSIDTRVINTQVLVNDGQTVVLGGIMETEQRESERKVPFLGEVPALGHLFKTTTRVNNKKELLIFVTPKILREGASLY